MTSTSITTRVRPSATGSRYVSRAFSLIELMTVVFIISLLIGILIPSISAARNAAKKATTAKALDSIKVGMEMFKTDNESDYRLTNGYPPSFAHPPIRGFKFDAYLGKFPFLDPASETNPPIVYGAHWLPAMLMGVDFLGYVKRSSVPDQQDLRKQPWRWYQNDPLLAGRPLDRMPLYLEPGGVRLRETKDLPGRMADDSEFFPDWDAMKTLPVLVDSFDQPILYYVASAHGRQTNMVGDKRDENNEYPGSADSQEAGLPYYFHQDNEGFTGTSNIAGEDAKFGWEFSGKRKGHDIGLSGADISGDNLVGPLGSPNGRRTFARYIIDRKIFQNVAKDPKATAPLRPVNADSYLLISAGPDGIYGSSDDVSNLPAWPD